jgi:phenylpropionate dioxygenase-like ring-hydroxylating dioxygenase large terminal subunit
MATAISQPRVNAADVDALLARGLRNRWYALCPSRFVAADKPLGIERAGERLVLWRDRTGALHVQDDRCPHRGAALSLARHRGDRLECVYHSVEVLGDGTVAAVPGMRDCPLVGQRLVRTYPAIEHRDAIFAYFGDALHPEPPPFRPPRPLDGDEWTSFLAYAEWNCPYGRVIDNLLDPMHAAFLHVGTHSMAKGRKTSRMRIVDRPNGFRFEKEDQSNIDFDWVEYFDDGGQFHFSLEIPYPATGSPGGNFWIVVYCTPISAGATAFFAWRARRLTGWQRDVWRFLYKDRLEERHYFPMIQDAEVLESIRDDAGDFENLYQHDVALARVRRQRRQEAEAQLASLRTAGGQV